MNTPAIAALMERLLNQVADLNAHADVIANLDSAFSLKAERGELSEYKVTSGQQIGIRLIKDNRVGIAYSESFDESALHAMVQDAWDASRFARQDSCQQICVANANLRSDWPELMAKENSHTEQKIALALALESHMCSKPHVQGAPYNGYVEQQHQLWLANSLGSFCQHQAASVSCSTSALIEHQGHQSMFAQSQYGRHFAELNANALVEQTYQMAEALLNSQAISSGRYSVIFSTNTLASLFACYQAAFSGKWAQQGINPWRQHVGQAVASSLLNISSRVYMPAGMNIKAFDGEGMACRDVSLIAGGQLVSLLHNSASAQHAGLTSNGCAARSARSVLDVSARHWVCETGTDSIQTVQQGRYLELVKLDGLHSGADAISGDFSFAASGFLCRDGARLQAVRGITVAGNFYQLLKQIEAIGSVLQHNDGKTFYAPPIRFADLHIAGQ